MNTFDEMKSSILAKIPRVQTLGPLWRLKAFGARRVENALTWEIGPTVFRQPYVTVSVRGKEYVERFGKLPGAAGSQ